MAKDIKDILRKYESKLEGEIKTEPSGDWSKEFKKFREEALPNLSIYERLCRNTGRFLKIKLNKEDEEKINRALQTAHLDLNARDTAAFSIFTFLAVILGSLLIFVGIYFLTGSFSILALFLIFFFAIFLYYYTASMPQRLAQQYRLKASSQMVPCILYVVVYMRHTSNLELAIKFASEHLQYPLALDFKKIFWNVQIGKYSTIKESLEAYLESWRDSSLEFVESFHLIESSLYEPNESRRIEILEKSLTVILDGVHEKMLHYTHDIRSPLTNIYMLGIVLPTLGLALLPLASTLLGGAIKWIHVAIAFNLIMPFFIFYLTNQILSKRPGGYGETELLEQNPSYHYYKSKKPYYKAFFIALPLILLSLTPLLIQYTPLPELFGLEKDYFVPLFGNIFDFKTNGVTTGPFGTLALLLSLFFPLGVALFFFISYKLKTEHLIKTRNETKKLETEFSSSVFQLGNCLADGIPAEMAFGRVAHSLRGTSTAHFFSVVNSNIQQLGMSVENAIFNPKRGAIIYFPSTLIKTSMRILIESVRKGLQVAAKAMMSISQYVKNIHKINERLKDLIAEIVSDMKSNMSFLAPMLTGIVVGLSAMITTILNKLQLMMVQGELAEESMIGGMSATTLTTMFDLTNMIPPYFLQIVIGIYLIEIIYILTKTIVSVEQGMDRLTEKSEIAKNLRRGMITYFLVALIAIIVLTLLANMAIGAVVA